MCKGDLYGCFRYTLADLIAAGDLDAAQPLVTDGVQALPAVGGAVQLVQPCHCDAQGKGTRFIMPMEVMHSWGISA